MGRPRSRRGRAREVIARLRSEHPGTAVELCALHHDDAFQLLVATILSAQCTDERVNLVTPAVFAAFPTPADLAEADPDRVEDMIRSTGFFRAKTRSLLGMATTVSERFGGDVPTSMSDLTTLPGVGRKTANVIRSVAFGLPGLPVDTHVGRLSRRLELTNETDPVKVEADLNEIVPASERGAFSLRLILHGRGICRARRPRCERCLLADICPSAEVPASWPGRPGARARSRSEAHRGPKTPRPRPETPRSPKTPRSHPTGAAADSASPQSRKHGGPPSES
jgi:endonuclease III